MSNSHSKRIFVSAGEASGDAILGVILETLREQVPDLHLHGLGGSAAIEQGLQPLFSMDQTGVNGLWDVLSRPLFLLGMYRRAVRELIQFKPDLVLLVDYPGLNLRLAQKARSRGFKVLFVAPPQLWVYKHSARRKARTLRALKGCSVHVIYPFEADDFATLISASVPFRVNVTAGHFFTFKPRVSPLSIPFAHHAFDDKPFAQNPSSKIALSLFPGSRLPVILRNLPLWIGYLEDYFHSPDSDFINKRGIYVLVPIPLKAMVAAWLRKYQKGKYQNFLILSSDKEAVLATTGLAIALPGTINLELFLHQIPTLVLTLVDPFTLALGKRLLKSARLSLPNLLLNEDIFPEWVGRRSDLTNPNFAGLMLTLQGLELDWPSLKSRIDSLLGPESGAKIAAQEGFRLLNT